MVTSTGLLGNSYLSISPGGSDKMIPPGGRIVNTQGSVDLMSLIGRFATGAGGSPGSQPAPAPGDHP
jgi:phospholipid/cholesterol/gamma-HCH transport system substrate-binding protein